MGGLVIVRNSSSALPVHPYRQEFGKLQSLQIVQGASGFPQDGHAVTPLLRIATSLSQNDLFNSENGFYWSIRNIAIVLRRNRSSITRTMNKMKVSEKWTNKLSSLRRNVKSETGIDIEVYHQDIFDLFLDYYEEEYLLRFAEPRHGNIETAPDINELRRFWKHLRAMESIQKSTFVLGGFVPQNREIKLPFSWLYRMGKAICSMFQFVKDKFCRT